MEVDTSNAVKQKFSTTSDNRKAKSKESTIRTLSCPEAILLYDQLFRTLQCQYRQGKWVHFLQIDLLHNPDRSVRLYTIQFPVTVRWLLPARPLPVFTRKVNLLLQLLLMATNGLVYWTDQPVYCQPGPSQYLPGVSTCHISYC